MTDEHKETNVVSIDKRARMRSKQKVIRKMFERDQTLWPDTHNARLGDEIIMNCQVMGILSAKELFMDHDWTTVVNSILSGMSEVGMDKFEVIEELQQANLYWKECCFETMYDGVHFDKVGSALTLTLDGVSLFLDPLFTEVSQSIQAAKYFVNGYRKGHIHGSQGTILQRIKGAYKQGETSGNYVTLQYTLLLELLSGLKVGNAFEMRPVDISTMSKEAWFLIIDALRSEDHEFLKNYPTKLITLVMTIGQFGNYTVPRLSTPADLFNFWTVLMKDFFGWSMEIHDGRMCIRMDQHYTIPLSDSIFGNDMALVMKYREVWLNETQGEK